MSDKRKDMDPAMATCQGEKKESRKAAQKEEREGQRERGEGGRRAAYDNADDDNDNDDYEPSTMIAFAESETMPVPPLDFCFLLPLYPLPPCVLLLIVPSCLGLLLIQTLAASLWLLIIHTPSRKWVKKHSAQCTAGRRSQTEKEAWPFPACSCLCHLAAVDVAVAFTLHTVNSTCVYHVSGPVQAPTRAYYVCFGSHITKDLLDGGVHGTGGEGGTHTAGQADGTDLVVGLRGVKQNFQTVLILFVAFFFGLKVPESDEQTPSCMCVCEREREMESAGLTMFDDATSDMIVFASRTRVKPNGFGSAKPQNHEGYSMFSEIKEFNYD